MNTSGLFARKMCCGYITFVKFTLQETRSMHDSMNIPKIKFIS